VTGLEAGRVAVVILSILVGLSTALALNILY
jgi:hypothetical protein